MDLRDYRNSAKEQERIRSLFQLIPPKGESALDIGARDGYMSLRLAERFDTVTALDLEKVEIDHPAVRTLQGDITALDISDNSFDLVLCAEVLEHIPPALLTDACAEIARVARDRIVIGVPYRQDIRYGRSVCAACGGINPPWGHVNVFDERTLASLFPGLRVEETVLVGRSMDRTNFLSAFLMDLAGNPYGTYEQEEGCVHCGAVLKAPERLSLPSRAASFTAHWVREGLNMFSAPRANWIHLLLRKPAA